MNLCESIIHTMEPEANNLLHYQLLMENKYVMTKLGLYAKRPCKAFNRTGALSQE